MTKQRQKLRLFFCTLLVTSLLFPTSPVFAETVQDVPVGETTISSKAEDPLKEYKERAQNQVPMVESVESQDVPGKTSETETFPKELEQTTGDSPTPTNDSSEEQPKITNQRIEPHGGIMPLAGTTLTEGVPGDPFPYDIDKNFADAIRSQYPSAPNPMTDDFMESLTSLDLRWRNLTSLKGVEYAVNLKVLNCGYNQLSDLDISNNVVLTNLTCNNNQLSDLDVSSNIALTDLDCTMNQLTNLNVSGTTSLTNLECSSNQLSDLNISNNITLKMLACGYNQLSSLDVSNNTALLSLDCNVNQLSDLDVSGNTKLERLNCSDNQLSNLDVNNNIVLSELECSSNQLSSLNVDGANSLERLNCRNNLLSDLDVSGKAALTIFDCSSNQLRNLNINGTSSLTNLSCSNNQLSNLNVSSSTNLRELWCENNELNDLDVSSNINLTKLICSYNQLSNLDVSSNTVLTELLCSYNELSNLNTNGASSLEILICDYNQLSDLDVSSNSTLWSLDCSNNELSNLNTNGASSLQSLTCNNNQLSDLDVSSNLALESLSCSNNELRDLNVNGASSLYILYCPYNQLSDLDVSSNTVLESLTCSYNRISDIKSANGLAVLTYFDASHQQITISVPLVSPSGEATVDILKTTAQTGLNPTNGNIVPTPTSINPNASNGDIIEITGVTRESLSGKSINFEYTSSALQEGAGTYSKKVFSGVITFAVASELKNELQVSSNKTKNGEELTWTWTITSLTTQKAEDIKGIFTLPNYVTGDISDIQIINRPSNTMQTGTMNHLNGTTSLGDLEQGESIEITFKSIARGDPDEWLEAIGRLDWSDTTPTSPYFNESSQRYKILDDEQQDLPKDLDDMGILSAPLRFYFGKQNLSASIATYHLDVQNYQTNTNVVTDGFYTRIKDDQAVSTGWKLTAGLSEFKDSGGRTMPNGAGTSLKLENMFVQKVKDRDTSQEALDPTAVGGPSTVQTTETLVAGQTAKTLVSAQVGEGQETWQLQMPFNDISLTLPASAGKSNTDYTAKLTWTLQDTP